MRKRQLVILILVCCFSFAGCSNDVPQSKYDAVCAERDALQVERDTLLARIEELSVASTEQSEVEEIIISGSFAATVWNLMPDYSLDETTLNVAIVSLFQCGPFAIYVGEELAAELKVGEQYVFEIEEKEVKKITYSTDPEIVIPLYHLRIKSARIAEEDEWGLDSTHIVYTEIK